MALAHEVSDTIARTTIIAAPVEKVWDLISIPGWWINSGTIDLNNVDRVADDRAVIHHPEHGDFVVERLDVDPPYSISFRWLVDGADGSRTGAGQDQFLHTRVSFTLAAEEGGTRLSVVESGFATATMDDAARRRAYNGNSEGWTVELGAAKTYVEAA